MYTVSEVARMSGVTVRTLHHYDEIGLLPPAHIGENRYRYYGREELLRLQQILLHRALGLPLEEISAILDDPDFDRVATLQKHRRKLQTEAEHYADLIRTIDRTIADLKGDDVMSDMDLYSGLVPAEKQAEYEAWLVEKYGPDMAEDIKRSKQVMADWTKGDMEAAMKQLAIAEQGLANAMDRGISAEDSANDPLIEIHRAWVARMWDKPCPPQAYAGLADMYLSHPDFEARYESIAKGFTTYLTDAMKAWAERQG
ncbi:MerR family transcriptional regulator [Cucumibacter marinus]|uniref:MerR family transcriptional regulator n=1 Tax=Cucumibacter marinus TaxID=1121252 RepID=UPI00048C385A|nr:MerR family transcriptional regulator [Cucumibacter marinus]